MMISGFIFRRFMFFLMKVLCRIGNSVILFLWVVLVSFSVLYSLVLLVLVMLVFGLIGRVMIFFGVFLVMVLIFMLFLVEIINVGWLIVWFIRIERYSLCLMLVLFLI